VTSGGTRLLRLRAAITAALGVLLQGHTGTLLLTFPCGYSASRQHHRDLLLPGFCGDTLLVGSVTGASALQDLHKGRGHLLHISVVGKRELHHSGTWLAHHIFLQRLSDVVRSACLEVSIAPPLNCLIPRAVRPAQSQAQAGQHQAAHNVHLH